jgi:hypothetical protein
MLFEYDTSDGLAHLIFCPDWFVTKVCMQADAATPCVLRFISPTQSSLGSRGVVNIAAGGSYTAEPGGAHRTGVEVSGTGSKVVIEYWFRANASALVPVPTVVPP